MSPNFKTMKTKEKAKELVDKFTMDNTRQGERNAIKCALIAVDELINQCHNYREIDLGLSNSYWLEVKNEINKI